MLFGHRKYQKIFAKISALHENARLQSEEKRGVLKDCVNSINKMALFLSVTFVLAVAMFWLYPVYAYFFQHRRELMFGVKIPMVDSSTFNGYIITMIAQLIFEIYGIIGMSAFDSMFMMFIFHTIAFNGLMQVDLKEFSSYLKENDPKERHKVNEKLEEILAKHMEMIE